MEIYGHFVKLFVNVHTFLFLFIVHSCTEENMCERQELMEILVTSTQDTSYRQTGVTIRAIELVIYSIEFYIQTSCLELWLWPIFSCVSACMCVSKYWCTCVWLVREHVDVDVICKDCFSQYTPPNHSIRHAIRFAPKTRVISYECDFVYFVTS